MRLRTFDAMKKVYAAKTWDRRKQEQNKFEVIEMKCQKSMYGVNRLDRLNRVRAGSKHIKLTRWKGCRWVFV